MSDQLPTTTLDGLDPAGALAGNNIIYTQDAEGNDQKATMQQVKDFVKPDAASINNDGIVNTAAQAFSGKKTFTSGLAATSSEISGNESVGGNLNVEGEITQNGQPLITDVKISEQEGNAIEKKEDGIYVSQSQADILDDNRTTTGNVWSASKVNTEIENVDNKNNYSTEEIIIGYWDDGRPIYRKLIVYSSPISVSENTDISVPNFDLSQVWGFLTCKLLRVREGTSSPMVVNANCRTEGSKLRVLTAGASSYGNLTRLILEYVKIL